MKKLFSAISIISALALTLCLFGCSDNNSSSSSSTNTNVSNTASNTSGNTAFDLDRTITLQGLTCNISSQWSEEDTYTEDSGSYIDGFTNYCTDDDSDEYCYVSIYYSNETLGWTAEEEIEHEMQYYTGAYYSFYSNPQYSLIDTITISGAECAIYEYSFINTLSGVEEETHDHIAYILGSKMHYSIDVNSDYDSQALLKAILDTVSIES